MTAWQEPIHSDVFGRYERRSRVDDVRNFTHSTQGMKLRQRGMIILGVHRRVGGARRHRVEPEFVRRIPPAPTRVADLLSRPSKLQPYDSKSCCRKSADTI
jgi:hypothetical protein